MGGIIELLAGSAGGWKTGTGVGASIEEVVGTMVGLSVGYSSRWSVGVPI